MCSSSYQFTCDKQRQTQKTDIKFGGSETSQWKHDDNGGKTFASFLIGAPIIPASTLPLPSHSPFKYAFLWWQNWKVSDLIRWRSFPCQYGFAYEAMRLDVLEENDLGCFILFKILTLWQSLHQQKNQNTTKIKNEQKKINVIRPGKLFVFLATMLHWFRHFLSIWFK